MVSGDYIYVRPLARRVERAANVLIRTYLMLITRVEATSSL